MENKSENIFDYSQPLNQQKFKPTELVNYLKEKNFSQIIVFSTRSETFLVPLSEILKEKKIIQTLWNI